MKTASKRTRPARGNPAIKIKLKKFAKYFIPSTLLCAISIAVLFAATGRNNKIIDRREADKTQMELTVNEAKIKPKPGFERYFCQGSKCEPLEGGKLKKVDITVIKEDEKALRNARIAVSVAIVFASILAGLGLRNRFKRKEEAIEMEKLKMQKKRRQQFS